MISDLDDTTGCPTAAQCDTCAARSDLSISTAQTPVGVFCCTLCGDCTVHGRLPTLGWAGAVDRSLRHCQHLGIDADQMAALMT